MDIRDLLRALRRHWWLVVTAVVGAVGLGAAVTELTVPQYATRMTFFVTTPSQGVTDAYQGGLFSQQRVKSYADLLTGDRLAGAVATEPGVGLTPTQIQARLSGTAVPDTVLLQVTVTDRSKARSQRVAEATAKHFIVLVQSLETPPGSDTPSVKVEVVAGPSLDPVPVTPRPMRNLALAAVLGLLVGAGGAALRELRDSTVKTVEVLQHLISAPVLAVVPFEAAAKKSPLIVEGHAQSGRAEAFRRLRTNLQFVDVDRPVKVIVVTSSLPEEGKSTTAVNLAIAFAEAGHRVLLIEADLRRPRVAHYLGLEGAVGLSNVLAGQVKFDEVLQKWGRRELFVMASGFTPPNPSELLGSRNMSNLLATQREEFDVTIIDTPPLLPVTDAAVVAASADGAVLVTRSGKTAQASLKTAADALRAVDARLLGGLLNMQPGGGDSGYYYYQNYRPKRDTPSTPPIERRDAKHAASPEPVRSGR
ncbi:polysaccharide biosynthesis tyrosine autokinase [Micromonospora sp. CPCC 206061]|uniref:polysaccharide biosynthesis tyrosine autokinase n=1 Tax=Micromonospora sp. CPCC 206061 TaxID=3122410 RepID=UPI002FEE97D6